MDLINLATDVTEVSGMSHLWWLVMFVFFKKNQMC